MLKALILLLSLGLVQSYAGTVYRNMTNDTFASLIFTDQPTAYVQAGDQIVFSDLSNLLLFAYIGTYNQSVSDIVSNATFRLYDVNPTGPVLGSLLTTVTLTDVTFASGVITTLTFNIDGTIASQNAVWTIEFSLPANLGINNFNPPTIGSSDADTYWASTASGAPSFYSVPGAGNLNFQASFDAVPEPSTFLLALIPLATLVHRARRGKQTS